MAVGREAERSTGAGTPAPPSLELRLNSGGEREVAVGGAWSVRGLSLRPGSAEVLRRRVLAASGWRPAPAWDLLALSELDRAGALVLWLGWQERLPAALRCRSEHQELLDSWSKPRPLLSTRPPRTAGPVTRRLRLRLQANARQARDAVALLGQLVLDLLWLLRHPRQIPWREISATIYLSGARALKITALVGLLIGIVVSYLSAIQLRILGAEQYVVDILGMSIIRELGPLLAAVLVAGRSGSAMTAELGVMRVTEELDAVAALGISQSQRLLLPKVVGLTLVLPLLVVWTDVMALAGGIVSAARTVDIGYARFLETLPDAVPAANLWLGVGKGAVFGALIALTACHYGMRIEPNTSSLGRETTNAVVVAITQVILFNALFAVAFQEVGFR